MGRAAQQPGSGQEDAPLTAPWFPRPAGAHDVRIIPPPGRWGAGDIYELLSDPGALEWRDRVGVVGRTDGSAKASTRLLAIRGWVAKTRVDQPGSLEDTRRRELLAARAPGLEAALWHPDKQWALLRGADGWYPLTLCPELDTLRRLEDIAARMRAWVEMIEMAVRISGEHGLGLDLNPANFGTRGAASRLYYIDDEFYPSLAERDVAGAIVARIPEEPAVERGAWEAWATTVARALRRGRRGALSWGRLCEEIQRYPVAEQFEESRTAVLAVFRGAFAATARSERASPPPGVASRLTCVLADVHANLPALEVTLEAATSLGADSYLFLGDVVGYGPHPAECIARLAELPNATLVRGNHDHAVATSSLDLGMNRLARRCAEWTISVLDRAELEWLGSLPIEHLTAEWTAAHGAPRDPHKFLAYVYELTYEENLRYLKQLAVPLCFYGHTHVQLVYAELAGPTKPRPAETLGLALPGPVLVNPGSVGQPRDGDPRAAFAMWDRANRRVSFHRVAYDVAKTLRDLRSRDLPVELDERLTTGT